MSAVEIAGIILTTLVLGTLNGALLARAWHRRQRQTHGVLVQQVEAYRDWLAAQKVLTRSSLAFLAAHRAMQPADDAGSDLKRNMFLQTRANWNDAIAALDRAEASLTVWSDDSDLISTLSYLTRRTRQVVQAGLQETSETFDQQVDEFRALDEKSASLVRSATQKIRQRHDGAFYLADRLISAIQSIMQRMIGTR